MNNKDRMIWIILTVGLLIGGYVFSIKDSRADDHDMRIDCYLNMSQSQVVVCLESMRVAVERMVEESKQLLEDIKPVKVES